MNTENFSEVFALHRFSEAVEEVNSRTPGDVEVTLHSISSGRKLNFSDFLSLISPSADSYLEELAIHSKEITLERFGKAIQLYTPLYLSNECRSSCLYCGFSFENRIPRKTLSEEELRREAEILKDLGFRHILVLTG